MSSTTSTASSSTTASTRMPRTNRKPAQNHWNNKKPVDPRVLQEIIPAFLERDVFFIEQRFQFTERFQVQYFRILDVARPVDIPRACPVHVFVVHDDASVTDIEL